jgi:hypothetical protein
VLVGAGQASVTAKAGKAGAHVSPAGKETLIVVNKFAIV